MDDVEFYGYWVRYYVGSLWGYGETFSESKIVKKCVKIETCL